MGDFEIELADSMKEVYNDITTDKPVAEVAETETVEDDAKTQSRGSDGRFTVKADGEEEKVIDAPVKDEPETVIETAEPEPETETETTEVETEPEPVDPMLVNPPDAWSVAGKGIWQDLPTIAKQEVIRREAESLRGVNMMRERAEFGDSMNEVINPYLATIQAEGSTPQQTVQGLMNTAYMLRNGQGFQKAQLAVEMAQKYGFMNELVASITQGGQNNQPMQPYNDPRIEELERKFTAQTEATEKAGTDEAVGLIQTFATETTEDGTLAHPYFENVRELMRTLIESGQQPDLASAYDAALWMNPETRTLMQTQQVSDTETKTQEQAAERVRKAKKAATVNLSQKGTHDSVQPVKPTGSVEDTMRETMANIKSRSG